MKKLLLPFLMLLCLTALGQSRQNRANAVFTQKSVKLTKATGWYNNDETGKWVENVNAIDKRPTEPYLWSYAQENFKWVQFAKVQNGADVYYALIIEKIDGEYEYPSIHQGWFDYTSTYCYFFDKDQYELLKKSISDKNQFFQNIKLSKAASINNRFATLGGEYAYTEAALLGKVTSGLAHEYKETYYLPISYQNADGVDVVRFKLPISYYTKIDIDADVELKDAYFEIPLSVFTKALI